MTPYEEYLIGIMLVMFIIGVLSIVFMASIMEGL